MRIVAALAMLAMLAALQRRLQRGFLDAMFGPAMELTRAAPAQLRIRRNMPSPIFLPVVNYRAVRRRARWWSIRGGISYLVHRAWACVMDRWLDRVQWNGTSGHRQREPNGPRRRAPPAGLPPSCPRPQQPMGARVYLARPLPHPRHKRALGIGQSVSSGCIRDQ